MKLIQLTQGKFAKVDDEDFDELNKFTWSLSDKKEMYARRTRLAHEHIPTLKVRMHRQILNITDSNIIVDHIDGDTLNNQKNNLRTVTHLESVLNRSKFKNTISAHKGVSVVTRKKGNIVHKYWIARIRTGKKRILLCCLSLTPENEIKAAKIYQKADLKYHGKFARLNPIV